MSSWCVFASLGLYPEIPGRAELVLGSPLFPEIMVHRAGGDLHIVAPGAATHSPYVQSLRVNGRVSTLTFLPESLTLHGGTLSFVLSATPATTWGTRVGDAPPSFSPR
jgi:putative alpha-1,2-mannosidase